MRCLPLLLLLACSEEVLPLGSTPAQCTAALEVSHTVFEDQTVTDPPATASIDGEVAVVLNQQSLEVVRFSFDARDPDPIASHTAELAKVLRLEGGSNDYHLLTRLYGSTDVWLAHQRVLDAASATWRAGEDVEILDAVVSNESVLVAVKTSLTTFRIHAAEDVTAVRGASFAPGGDVASARIFPRARLVASWST